jgi:hypothetical protein
MNRILEAWILGAFVGVPVTSHACSLLPCSNRSIEVQRDFIAIVKFAGRPLPGVSVEVRTSSSGQPYLTALTDAAGEARIRPLVPGDYWISVKYLEVSAGYHCFRVLPYSSLRAKGRLKYRWGESGLTLRSLAASAVDWQPDTGGTLLWNQAHSHTVPIIGAVARLEDARTRESFRSVSDAAGKFAFPVLPEGAYVLHVEGSTASRGYEASDILLSVEHSAARQNLVLRRRETGCGDAVLEPDRD